MASEIDRLVEELADLRQARCFPPGLRSAAREITDRSLALLFPHYSVDLDSGCDKIREELDHLGQGIESFLHQIPEPHAQPQNGATTQFLTSLPSLHHTLLLDARAMYHGDPAATSVDEVILAYPGFVALAVHRVAHELFRLGFPLLPRLASEYAHHRTGIDIHPGAAIGRSFAIDHGTGIVIGETAIVGNGVKVYQGVTLGAVQVDKRLADRKRHPTIGDNVVIYANATILGGETVIGHDTIVGANAWVSESVPPFSVVGRHSDVRPRRSGADADLEFHI